jgi:drug/metabolite transporter (DMT)-like permease
VAYVILFAAQIAIGAAAIFARYALHGAGPIVVSALRLSIASLPLVFYNFHKHKGLKLESRHEIQLALAGITLAIHFSTWIGSLLYTSVAVSTLLVSTVPVWTALYDVLVLRKKMPFRFWLAFIAAGLGTYQIVTAGAELNGTAPIAGRALLGEVFAGSGGIAFAAYLITIRSLSNIYPTLVIVGRTYSWAAMALVLGALLVGESPPQNDTTAWFGIIAMALVSQLLGHTALNASLRAFSATVVALSTLLEPVFAAILAVLFLQEHLSLQTMVGSLIVLASLAVILRMRPDEEKRDLAAESNEI